MTARPNPFDEVVKKPRTRSAAPPPAAAEPAPASRPASRPAPAAPAGERPSKFTVLFEQAEAADFDGLQLAVRRQLAQRVDKAAIVRALVALAADDLTLREQLVEELRRQRP